MFECHITINPVPLEEREKIEVLVKPFKFRLAKLMMIKNDGTPGAPFTFDTFMTTNHVRCHTVKTRMKNALSALMVAGYNPRRAKIESILFDTKQGDIVVFDKDTKTTRLLLKDHIPY